MSDKLVPIVRGMLDAVRDLSFFVPNSPVAKRLADLNVALREIESAIVQEAARPNPFDGPVVTNDTLQSNGA